MVGCLTLLDLLSVLSFLGIMRWLDMVLSKLSNGANAPNDSRSNEGMSELGLDVTA